MVRLLVVLVALMVMLGIVMLLKGAFFGFESLEVSNS